MLLYRRPLLPAQMLPCEFCKIVPQAQRPGTCNSRAEKRDSLRRKTTVTELLPRELSDVCPAPRKGLAKAASRRRVTAVPRAPPARPNDLLESQHSRSIIVRPKVAVHQNRVLGKIRGAEIPSDHIGDRGTLVTTGNLKSGKQVIVATQPFAEAVELQQSGSANETGLQHRKL